MEATDQSLFQSLIPDNLKICQICLSTKFSCNIMLHLEFKLYIVVWLSQHLIMILLWIQVNMKWQVLITTCFQVNSALTLDHTKSQWVDLGFHTEACMTRPETCGAAGAAMSLWVNIIDCPPISSIIYSDGSSTGSRIDCRSSEIRYGCHLLPIFSHNSNKVQLCQLFMNYHVWLTI